nr:MAG TPA: hypothetical protein [Caudoviricetes sp.]
MYRNYIQVIKLIFILLPAEQLAKKKEKKIIL